jgi:hypothetical protein
VSSPARSAARRASFEFTEQPFGGLPLWENDARDARRNLPIRSVFECCVGAFGPGVLALSPKAQKGGLRFEERTMAEPKEMDVIRRAYELWQRAGQPSGKDDEFYHQAKRELQEALDKEPPRRE